MFKPAETTHKSFEKKNVHGFFSRKKIVFFSLLPALVLFVLIETTAQVYWLHLKEKSLHSINDKGKEILRNDAINFLKVSDPILGYRLKKNLNLPQCVTTSQGFHQREAVSIRRTLNSLRLMIIGESTTMGHNVGTGNYPAHLRGLLRSYTEGYSGGTEVINAGVAGWTSDQEMIWVETELKDYHPDIVIIYSGWNDFQSYDPFASPPKESYFDTVYKGNTIHISGYGLKSVILARGILTSLIKKANTVKKIIIRSENIYKPENNSDEVYFFYIRNIKRIVSIFRKNNSQTTIVLCTLAGRWPLSSEEDYQNKNGCVWWMKKYKVSQDEAYIHLKSFNNVIKDIAKKEDLMLIDIEQYYTNLDRAALMRDFAHMTDEGYKLMAEIIYNELVKAGKINGKTCDELTALLNKNTRK